MRRKYLLFATITLALLTSCARNPYGEKSLVSGGMGYTETQIDDATYEVRYDGNAKVSKDAAWNFWIYRCAELTKLKGYTHFTLAQNATVGDATSPPVHRLAADFSPDDAAGFVKVKGGGGHTSYIYLPGSSITTWHSHATIRMFNEIPPDGIFFAMDAPTILGMLGDFVTTQGKSWAPAQSEILNKANVRVNLSPLRGT